MGYLAATLNYMSDELNKMEEYQKTFIANVSHDFRSPLTSIKGYLEAILDGTIPPEMYEKYLTRVITETERLNKLTQGMLTLNTLDSKGYSVSYTHLFAEISLIMMKEPPSTRSSTSFPPVLLYFMARLSSDSRLNPEQFSWPH